MPAGEPALGSSSSNRRLLGNDLKDSDASSGHARDCQPTPGQARTGDRRSGPRFARASATNAGLGATHVPTHERPITWDICREPRHPPLRFTPANPSCLPGIRRLGSVSRAVSAGRQSTALDGSFRAHSGPWPGPWPSSSPTSGELGWPIAIEATVAEVRLGLERYTVGMRTCSHVLLGS